MRKCASPVLRRPAVGAASRMPEGGSCRSHRRRPPTGLISWQGVVKSKSLSLLRFPRALGFAATPPRSPALSRPTGPPRPAPPPKEPGSSPSGARSLADGRNDFDFTAPCQEIAQCRPRRSPQHLPPLGFAPAPPNGRRNSLLRLSSRPICRRGRRVPGPAAADRAHGARSAAVASARAAGDGPAVGRAPCPSHGEAPVLKLWLPATRRRCSCRLRPVVWLVGAVPRSNVCPPRPTIVLSGTPPFLAEHPRSLRSAPFGNPLRGLASTFLAPPRRRGPPKKDRRSASGSRLRSLARCPGPKRRRPRKEQ
jgi:hypothetical protein